MQEPGRVRLLHALRCRRHHRPLHALQAGSHLAGAAAPHLRLVQYQSGGLTEGGCLVTDVTAVFSSPPAGFLAFLAGGLVLLLPETRGRPLPETIDDIEFPEK